MTDGTLNILEKLKNGQNHRVTKDDGDAIDLLQQLKNIGVLKSTNGVYFLSDVQKVKDIEKLIEFRDFSKFLKWSHTKPFYIKVLKLISENPLLSGILLLVIGYVISYFISLASS